jgi:prolycopene isomerase
MNDFDAIVIGAGNAGLTAATTLQRGGMQTLLVERHNLPGGAATSFRRGRFEFEVALHQMSGVGVDGQYGSLRGGLFGQLGITDKLQFVEEHDLYRTIVPGVFDVTLPADWDGAIEALEAAFPGNRVRVEKFFALIKSVTFWQIAAIRGTPADQIDPVLFREGLRPFSDVLDQHFDDDRIKSALSRYWTYLGQPPSKLAFQDIALVMFAYLQFKPWHIHGGSQAMSLAILDSFLLAGGTTRFNTTVSAILSDAGRVCGVRLEDGTEITASNVVSNASLPITYHMLDGMDVPLAVQNDLATRRIGVSGFVVHLGLDAAPDELGFTSSTTFIGVDVDDDRTYASWSALGPPRAVVATCYDIAPIGFAPRGATHASLMTLQYADIWRTVQPSRYTQTKFDYAQTIVDLVEQHLTPGICDVIEEVDVATPLTMMRYLGHPGGAIYGYDQDATDSWLFRTSERQTHVPGLYLAGTWTGMNGFQPTLEAGARVARRLLRTNAA